MTKKEKIIDSYQIIYVTWEEDKAILSDSDDENDDFDRETFKFNSGQSVDNQPSAERKYMWKVAGQILYVNEEEFKYLYHWDELQEKAKHSRCQVCGKKNKYNFEFKEKRMRVYKMALKKSHKKITNIIELIIGVLSLLIEIVSLIVTIIK